MPKNRVVKYSLPQFDHDTSKEFITIINDIDLKDNEFITNSFLSDLSNEDLKYRDYIYKSVADAEYMDTSLGGHIAVNIPYGNTRFADIPNRGRDLTRDDFVTNKFSPTLGPGRFYAESIMRFSKPRILHLEFGVPNHRSMFSFFTEAISFRESIIAREGRTTFFFDIGYVGGLLVVTYAFPLRTFLVLGLKAGANLFFGDSDPRYYTFKPTMHNYALAANSILKSMMIERGVIRLDVSEKNIIDSKDTYGTAVKINAPLMKELQQAIPYIFNHVNEIDILRIVSRPQLLVNKMLAFERTIVETGNKERMPGIDIFTDDDRPNMGEFIKAVSRIGTFKSNIDEDGKKLVGVVIPTSSANIDTDEYSKPDNNGLKKRLPHDNTSWLDDFGEYMGVLRNMGFEQVGFYVDYVGTSTYSFTNEIKDIPAKSMLNSVGGASRDSYFNLSGGNIIGETVQDILKAGRDVAAGFLDSASFGLSNVLSVLVGGGYVSFPKMWSDSNVSLPNHSFKMTLGGPSGDALSLVTDIDVPLSMILAGALPISVGRASYTSPFLCKAFMQGIVDIDFGMITSLSITAGTGVLGRTHDGAALQLEVQFTITDFTDIVTARVSDGIFGAYSLQFDEVGALNRILRSISGRSFRNSRYVGKGFRYRLTAVYSSIGSATDPARIASWVSDTALADITKIGRIDNKATSLFNR